jgi:hypothetical protein
VLLEVVTLTLFADLIQLKLGGQGSIARRDPSLSWGSVNLAVDDEDLLFVSCYEGSLIPFGAHTCWGESYLLHNGWLQLQVRRIEAHTLPTRVSRGA